LHEAKPDVLHTLRATFKTTRDPLATRWLLPDGTRLTFTEAHAHSTVALQAGLTLAAILKAGVIRYMAHYGIEGVGGLMTERQARIIIDDWIVYRGYELQVDIDRADGKTLIQTKSWDITNDEIDATTLRAWFNRQHEAVDLRSFNQFIAEAAFTPNKLRALMNTTTQPEQTRFILPDGTRLRMADDRGEHSDAVAPYTLAEVMLAGVIRVRPTYGNDHSTNAQCRAKITERQAAILADDATLRGGKLNIDVQPSDNSDYRSPAGYHTDYREFDPPVKASIVRAWVNKHF
jgi:hypothetical protein